MMDASKRWLAAVTFVFVSAHAGSASASDTAACTSAAEKGQRARAAGKLLEAQKHFTMCAGAMRCPAIVEQDCAKWAAEVADATPSIVVDARDPDGRDVGDVTVIVDGTVVATELDGKAIPIDPGPHSVVFARKGSPDVVEHIIAKEGAKARPLRVTFSRSSSAPESAPTNQTGGHTIFPWLVVGVGAAVTAAGIVVILTAPALPAGCDPDTQRCTYLDPVVSENPVGNERRPTAEETSDLARRRDTAGRSITQPKIGLGIAAAGAVVLAGGIAWHLLEPRGAGKTEPMSSSARIRATPWLSPAGGGLVAAGTF